MIVHIIFTIVQLTVSIGLDSSTLSHNITALDLTGDLGKEQKMADKMKGFRRRGSGTRHGLTDGSLLVTWWS